MDDENLPALMLHALQGVTQAGQARRSRYFSRPLDWQIFGFFGLVVPGLNKNFSDFLVSYLLLSPLVAIHAKAPRLSCARRFQLASRQIPPAIHPEVVST